MSRVILLFTLYSTKMSQSVVQGLKWQGVLTAAVLKAALEPATERVANAYESQWGKDEETLVETRTLTPVPIWREGTERVRNMALGLVRGKRKKEAADYIRCSRGRRLHEVTVQPMDAWCCWIATGETWNEILILYWRTITGSLSILTMNKASFKVDDKLLEHNITKDYHHTCKEDDCLCIPFFLIISESIFDNLSWTRCVFKFNNIKVSFDEEYHYELLSKRVIDPM